MQHFELGFAALKCLKTTKLISFKPRMSKKGCFSVCLYHRSSFQTHSMVIVFKTHKVSWHTLVIWKKKKKSKNPSNATKQTKPINLGPGYTIRKIFNVLHYDFKIFVLHWKKPKTRTKADSFTFLSHVTRDAMWKLEDSLFLTWKKPDCSLLHLILMIGNWFLVLNTYICKILRWCLSQFTKTESHSPRTNIRHFWDNWCNDLSPTHTDIHTTAQSKLWKTKWCFCG